MHNFAGILFCNFHNSDPLFSEQWDRIFCEHIVCLVVESLINQDNPGPHDLSVESESDMRRIEALLTSVYSRFPHAFLSEGSCFYPLDFERDPSDELLRSHSNKMLHRIRPSAWGIRLYYYKAERVVMLVRREWNFELAEEIGPLEECAYDRAVRVNIPLVSDGDYVRSLQSAFAALAALRSKD